MKKKILIVDDDMGTRAFVKYLMDKFYLTKSCADVREAIEWMSMGNMPDLIISDMVMPRVNGLEFLKWVRRSGFYHHIPFIILSGIQREDWEQEKIIDENVLYLQKPFNPDILLQNATLLTNHTYGNPSIKRISSTY